MWGGLKVLALTSTDSVSGHSKSVVYHPGLSAVGGLTHLIPQQPVMTIPISE